VKESRREEILEKRLGKERHTLGRGRTIGACMLEFEGASCEEGCKLS
jgi:hypothetical protein